MHFGSAVAQFNGSCVHLAISLLVFSPGSPTLEKPGGGKGETLEAAVVKCSIGSV